VRLWRSRHSGARTAGPRTDQSSAALSGAFQVFGRRAPPRCGVRPVRRPGTPRRPVRVWRPGQRRQRDFSPTTPTPRPSPANRAATTQDGAQSETGFGDPGARPAGSDGAGRASQPHWRQQIDPFERRPRRFGSGARAAAGSVAQSNGAASSAAAGNDASTGQSGRQSIAGKVVWLRAAADPGWLVSGAGTAQLGLAFLGPRCRAVRPTTAPAPP